MHSTINGLDCGSQSFWRAIDDVSKDYDVVAAAAAAAASQHSSPSTHHCPAFDTHRTHIHYTKATLRHSVH